jgi:hypothetical protein
MANTAAAVLMIGLADVQGEFLAFVTALSSPLHVLGPNQAVPNAPRHSIFIQRAFYNGWKKHHGLKYFSLMAFSPLVVTVSASIVTISILLKMRRHKMLL